MWLDRVWHCRSRRHSSPGANPRPRHPKYSGCRGQRGSPVCHSHVTALVMGGATALRVVVADVVEESKVPSVSVASSSTVITDSKAKEMRAWPNPLGGTRWQR